jgi:hypothetical protein
LYDYAMIFSNTLIGIAVMSARFIMWAVLGILCMGRIDLCLLPGPGVLQPLDIGYATYVALVLQDHRYNNPISAVFFEILESRLARFRRLSARHKLSERLRMATRLGTIVRAKHGQRKPPSRIEVAEEASSSETSSTTPRRHKLDPRAQAEMMAEVMGDVSAALTVAAGGALKVRAKGGFRGVLEAFTHGGSPPRPPTSATVDGELVEAAQRLRAILLRQKAPAAKHVVDRQRRARNRWQLARMLLVNPVLRQYRGHRLAHQMEPQESTAAEGDAGETPKAEATSCVRSAAQLCYQLFCWWRRRPLRARTVPVGDLGERLLNLPTSSRSTSAFLSARSSVHSP